MHQVYFATVQKYVYLAMPAGAFACVAWCQGRSSRAASQKIIDLGQ